MTTVRYRKTGMGYEMEISGHAGSAPRGEDLICAACTILAYTLISATEGRGELRPQYYISNEDALIRVLCRPEEGMEERCEEIFRAIESGFEVLALRHPEYVEVR